jgi:hypothetical protein
MQIAMGANRLPKYWIKFLLFSAALHSSTLGPQNLGDCGMQWQNAMLKLCILCKKLWKMWQFLCRTINFPSLMRFCHVVCNHILSWTVLDLDFIPVNHVGNVEELDMDMTCMLSRACFTILFQSHRAGNVLIDNVGFDFKTLGFNEKF